MDAGRRTVIAGTVFSTWVVLGLFLDGWAHNAGKPEDFWTPWHAVLYSGFVAAVLWSAVDRNRQRRAGEAADTDPLVVLGFVAFGIAGVGDAVWHGIFGVEEDVAALLSPTHLALMIGGLLLITAPLRTTVTSPVPHGWRGHAPTVVAVTLATSVIAFFLQFVSPFHGVDAARYGPSSSEAGQLLGVAAVLLTNALLVAAAAWLSARPSLPTGTFTFVLGSTALLVSSQSGFATVELVGAAIAAGLVMDLAARRGASRRVVLVALPAVLWPGWFAVYHVRWGLGWPAEYWTGVVVFAVLTAFGLELLPGRPGVGTGTERTSSTSALPRSSRAPHARSSRAPHAEAVGYSAP